MKKFKALLSSVLALVLLCSCIVLPANAQQILPESEHRYTNNFYGEWDYTYSNKDAEGIFVTFSENTYTEDSGSYKDIYFDGDEDITIEDVLEEGLQSKIGDIISIYDSKQNLIGVYQGDELAGATVYVPDSSFKITLITDGSLTAYGFKVTNVTDEIPEDAIILRYHMPDGSIRSDIGYEYGKNPTINEDFDHIISGDEAIIGWTFPDGEDLYYASNYDISIGLAGVYDLYAISTPVQLRPTDVYGFTNSHEYFDFDGDKYYMTKEHLLRFISSTCLAGGATPLALPAAILSTVIVSYSELGLEWLGACVGFANTVCLQKKGIIDVVSTQPGATCVRDLKPTPELISLLNYYNAHAATMFLPKDKAFKPGSKEYTRQLEKLVNSALDGNLILLELVPVGTELSDTVAAYHGIVITGAYKCPDGDYALLYYDENDKSYADEGRCNTLYVSADFSEIYYNNLMIFWTDSFEEYRSIDLDIKKANSFSMLIEYFKHIIELIREWFDYYIKGLFIK